jgi:ubiquinone/menaquinone biosynthesis C-methylase UbiE
MAKHDLKSFKVLNDRESFYDGWDDYYKEQGDAAWGDEPPPWLSEALNGRLKPGQSLADFGAGDARNSLGLLGESRSLTLVDISAPGIERASQRSRALGILPRPTLVVASLEKLPLGQGQFDLAICVDALPQCERPRLALQEMSRTLVPGGTLIVNVFTPSDCAFGEGEPLDARSFLYKNTLFKFFEDAEFRPFLQGLFEVVECRNVRWDDPPHVPFRPYPHTHDAIVYVLKKY